MWRLDTAITPRIFEWVMVSARRREGNAAHSALPERHYPLSMRLKVGKNVMSAKVNRRMAMKGMEARYR